MSALIAAELLKLRTTRSLWFATGAILVLSLALPVIIAVSPDGPGMPELTPTVLAETLRAPARLIGGAVLLVGLLAAAGEYRHHTVLTTRLVEPRQLRVLAAKMIAVGAVGLAVGLLADVVAAAAGGIALSVNGIAVEPLSHQVPRIAATVALLVALHGLAGVAVGSVIRSTAGAVGATLLWVFVIEGVVPVVTRRPEIVHWLPGGAVQDVLAMDAAPDGLAPWAAGALLAGYIGALVVTAATLDTRREI